MGWGPRISGGKGLSFTVESNRLLTMRILNNANVGSEGASVENAMKYCSAKFQGSLEMYITRMTIFAKSRSLWLLAGLFLLASASARSVPGATMGATLRLSNAANGMVSDQVAFNATDATAGFQDAASKSSAFNRVGIYVVGFVCALLLIMTISVLAVFYLRHKRRMAAVNPWRQGMSGQLQHALETTVPLLEREALEVACEDFSNIIGSSPDSVVYKGTLPNGTEIAAMSIQMPSSNWTPQNELSFRHKVNALARMKHTHLVNFIGCCSQEEPWTRIFVFEYVSNGTLHDHLHNKESEHLNWAARMRVVVGAAYGLRYMHHGLVPPENHTNFGADSVYLTDDYAAKVSNFGVTKVPMIRNGSQKSSWFALKTAGHENADSSDGHDIDFESNIYSFGVFLLEVITGRSPQSEQGASLVEWAAEYLSDPKMMWYMVDPFMKSYNHDELVALCKIASMCLSTETQRPSMLRVSDMLADVLKLSPELVSAKSTAALWAQLELQDDSPLETELL